MPAEPLRASVIIATRDRPEELRGCLASVRLSMAEGDEVIVVDSCSADAAVLATVTEDASVRLIRSENSGSARARNFGIRAARGDILLFTDDDARVAPDWLQAVKSAFADPRVGVVVGPVLEMGREPPALVIEFASFDAARDFVVFERTQADWFERLRFGGIGSGANLAVRRAVFDRIGLFRQGLGQGAPIVGDETFFLFDAVDRGERVVNVPSVRVEHPPQSPKRLEQIQGMSVAYLMYLILDRPSIAMRAIRSVLLRRRRRGMRSLATRPKRQNLLRAIMGAPPRVRAARRVDRETSRR